MQSHPPSSMLKTILFGLLLVYIGIALMAYFFADRLIFLPSASSYAADRFPLIYAPTEDGARIAMLHLPNPAADLTLIYSHGNAEDLGHLVGILELIRDASGVSVLAFDYRGYGQSSRATPTAKSATLDLEAVYRYAMEALGVPPERIILHGRSVGSGPTLELAAREPVGGVVIESGFVSAFRVVTRVQLLPFDRFPNLRHLRDVRAPVMVIHGDQDEVIPFSHGQRLFEDAAEPKVRYWVEGAGHNDLVQTAGPDYWTNLGEFVRLVEGAPRG